MPKPLTQKNLARINKAQSKGNLDQVLANRPVLRKRYNAATAGPGIPAGHQDYMGAANMPAPPMPTPTSGKAMTPPPAAAPAAAPTPPPAAPPTFSQLLEQQFGTDNPFSMDAGKAAFDEIARTSVDRADYLLKQNLGELGARYGGTGMGNSSRRALQEGAAIGESSSALGAALAQLGLQESQSSRDRAGNLLLGSGQLALGQQRLPLEYLDILMRGGSGLLGLESSEQVPPLLQLLMPLLGTFSHETHQGYQTTP